MLISSGALVLFCLFAVTKGLVRGKNISQKLIGTDKRTITRHHTKFVTAAAAVSDMSVFDLEGDVVQGNLYLLDTYVHTGKG